MHYFSFHISDYMSHTAHLTPIEDIAYIRCMMIYYLHEKPLVEDIGEVAREIRMPDNIPEVTYVLNKYFTHDVGKGWTLARADEEIQKYKNKLAASSRGGKSAALVNRKSTANELPPTNNQEPITKKHKTVNKTLKRPDTVTKKTWDDFLKHRRNVKAPLTETALKGITNEAKKASVSLEEALTMCQARGWRGFKSDWVTKEKKSFATTSYGEGVQEI